MKFFGLKNCDTCRKASRELTAAGLAHDYVDVRVDGVTSEDITRWLRAVSADVLVNKRSTTWRTLSDAEKQQAEDPAQLASLLVANPTLIKRPVIERDEGVSVGWTKAVKDELGV